MIIQTCNAFIVKCQLPKPAEVNAWQRAVAATTSNGQPNTLRMSSARKLGHQPDPHDLQREVHWRTFAAG
jgi:hypothetical protein